MIKIVLLGPNEILGEEELLGTLTSTSTSYNTNIRRIHTATVNSSFAELFCIPSDVNIN